MSRTLTLQDLAEHLGLSRTTVSEALRGRARVNAGTRERVCRAAEELGYRRNTLVGEVMAELRRSGGGAFRGNLAVLDLDGPRRRSAGGNRYHEEVARGAVERAAELDFKADGIVAEAGAFSPARVREILLSRGVRGVLVLPLIDRLELARFDWSGLAGLYADYLNDRPGLHAICPDHFRAMILTLERLHALGYRRPGLVLHERHDARLLHRWEAAFRSHLGHHSGLVFRAPYFVAEVNRGDGFKRWFRGADCDVVVAHYPEARRWMEEVGARVPETHGFCCLNLVNLTRPCAGLDMQPRMLGARAAELLIGQIMRNETGVLERPLTTTMPVDWVDGPTLRRQGGG